MTSKLKCPDGIPFTEVRPLNTEDCFIEDLSITLKPEQGFGDFTFCFKDGTSATFKNARSLQEFLDKLARFHELEKDLKIARQALEKARINLDAIQPYLGDEYVLVCKQDGLKAIDDALEQIKHKE